MKYQERGYYCKTARMTATRGPGTERLLFKVDHNGNECNNTHLRQQLVIVVQLQYSSTYVGMLPGEQPWQVQSMKYRPRADHKQYEQATKCPIPQSQKHHAANMQAARTHSVVAVADILRFQLAQRCW